MVDVGGDRVVTTADESAPGRSIADGADAARARLARSLRDSGRTPSPAVQAAFRSVPRHLFVPELAPAAAYQDEALVIKYGDDGLPVSSSSQPAMMAIMLEQLGLEPGHRVLEIGTGTGYNAAVMAHVVGPRGLVVTVDIDAGLVARAKDSLMAAGYGTVLASCGDGGYGDPQGAPFDRIIVTAGAWDIAPAWLDQLAPGGRLVVPLAVRSIQLSVGLERGTSEPGASHHGASDHGASHHGPSQPGARRGEHWVSTSAFRCGFVRMAGAFADPALFRPLGLSPGLYVQADEDRPVDTGALAAALAGPSADIGAGIRVSSRNELADLDLWLTLTEPGLDRLTIMETAASRAQVGPLLPFGGLVSRGAERGELGIGGLVGVRAAGAGAAPAPAPVLGAAPAAAAAAEEGHQMGAAAGNQPADQLAYPGEVMVRGYGPGGPVLAAHLADQVAAWDGLGRPGTADLCLTVSQVGTDLTAAAGQVILSRPHVTLAAGWPAS
jgi:protein-L-isoaspartate(D-aspartate) O-methyltransferase